jgi:hypothetical protein
VVLSFKKQKGNYFRRGREPVEGGCERVVEEMNMIKVYNIHL